MDFLIFRALQNGINMIQFGQYHLNIVAISSHRIRSVKLTIKLRWNPLINAALTVAYQWTGIDPLRQTKCQCTVQQSSCIIYQETEPNKTRFWQKIKLGHCVKVPPRCHVSSSVEPTWRGVPGHLSNTWRDSTPF